MVVVAVVVAGDMEGEAMIMDMGVEEVVEETVGKLSLTFLVGDR